MRASLRFGRLSFLLLGGLGAAVALLAIARASGGTSMGFSYSGSLKNNGVAETGPLDLAFDLVDGLGAAVGCPTDVRMGHAVTGGRFDVPGLFSSCPNLATVLATQSNLAVRITVDGQVLSPDQPLGAVPVALHAVNGSGSSAAFGATAFLDAVRDRIALQSASRQSYRLRSASLVDGFQDAAGVQPGSTTGAFFDPIHYYVANLTGSATQSSSVSQWQALNNGTSYWTFSPGGAITRAGSSFNFSIQGASKDLTGDFDYAYTQPNDSSTVNNEWEFGVSTGCCVSTQWLGIEAKPNTYWIAHGGVGNGKLIEFRAGTSTVLASTTINIAGGDVFTLRRLGSNVLVYQNSTLLYTYTGIETAPMYRVVAQGGNAQKFIGFNNVNWITNKVGGTMNLVSVAATADAPPTSASLSIREQDVDAVVLNSDLQAFVTCQDLAGWVPVTLASAGAFDGSSRLLTGQAALTCAGGNTAMRYKLVAQNGKLLRIRGVELDWQ